MIRTIAPFALLALLALVGVWAGLAMYDIAAIYADPVGSDLQVFSVFGGPVVFVVGAVVGIAVAAAATARARLRGPVRAVAAVLVVLSVTGIVVGNHLGVQAKQVETSEPPRCGISNPQLATQFESLDHPGFFGGGTSSRRDCSYMLTMEDPAMALAGYEKQFRAASWQVSVSGRRLTAAGPGYRFAAVLDEPVRGDPYLTVTLRQLRRD